MERFSISVSQLEAVCKMALRQEIAHVDSVRIVSAGDNMSGDWAVAAILPRPQGYARDAAEDILIEIHRAFAISIPH